MMQKKLIQVCMDSGALAFGSFTLKSERTSPFFFNLGKLHSSSDLAFLAACYAKTISDSGITFNVVFGPAYKGIPIASAICVELGQNGVKVDLAFDRKEAKDHGEGGFIVGYQFGKGDRVLIVDDVITAGTAIRNSISLIKEKGAEVAGVVVALDRQEKGKSGLSAIQELQKEYGFSVMPMIKLDDIIALVEKSGDHQEHVDAIKKYRKEYGV